MEQILGKADVKASTKELKARTQSKISMHPTYHVPASGSTVFVRTPNFLKIQPARYEESTYAADSERKLLDGSTAVARWRFKRYSNGEIVLGADGKPVKESNARLLQWADGTVHLVVGDAIFVCKTERVESW